MKLIKINDMLMHVFLILTIFASALNYTYLPVWVDWIRDFIIYYFAFIVLLKLKVKKPVDVGKSFFILMIIVFVVSWFGIINNTMEPKYKVLEEIIKCFELFLVFFIFTNLSSITTLKINKIMKNYVNLSLVLIFVNIIGYFIPNPIISRTITARVTHGFYQNRITLGQPAVAIFPAILSFWYLIIFEYKEKKNMFKILILSFGIIISVSITGILNMIILIFIMLLYSIKSKKYILVIGKYFFILIVVAMGIYATVSTSKELNGTFDNAKELYVDKIESIFTTEKDDPSLKVRDYKYELVLKNRDNVFAKIFGIGIRGYNNNGVIINSFENTYRDFLISFGILGLSVYLIFIFGNIIKYFKRVFFNKDIKENINIFLLGIYIIMAMHSYTLDILFIPTLCYSFGIFYCYAYKREEIEI